VDNTITHRKIRFLIDSSFYSWFKYGRM